MHFHKLTSEHKKAAIEVVQICFPGEPKIYAEFEERFEAHLSPQQGAYVVNFVGMFNNSQLAGIGGYAMSSMTDSCWELSWGAILPKFRGLKNLKESFDFVSKKILESAITDQVYLLTHARDAQFYKKLGFQKAFDANLDKPVLWKRLR